MDSKTYWDKTFKKLINHKDLEKKIVNISYNGHKLLTLSNILSQIDNLKEDKKLEVGCGCGILAKYMNWNENYTGVELSHVGVEIANIFNLNVIESDIHEWETDEKFDTILFMDSLEHILHLDRLAFKLKDMLTKKGRIIVNIPLCIGGHLADFDYPLGEDNVRRFFTFSGLDKYKSIQIDIDEIDRSYQFFEGVKT